MQVLPLSHQYFKTPLYKLFFSLSVAPKHLDGFLLTLISKHFHFRTTDLNFKPELVFPSSAVSEPQPAGGWENIPVVGDDTLVLISSQRLLMATIRNGTLGWVGFASAPLWLILGSPLPLKHHLSGSSGDFFLANQILQALTSLA